MYGRILFYHKQRKSSDTRYEALAESAIVQERKVITSVTKKTKQSGVEFECINLFTKLRSTLKAEDLQGLSAVNAVEDAFAQAAVALQAGLQSLTVSSASRSRNRLGKAFTLLCLDQQMDFHKRGLVKVHPTSCFEWWQTTR